MSFSRRAGSLAGLLLAFACALPAVASAAITVRVEGESATILPRTSLTLGAYGDAPGCGRTGSALAAFNAAVGGDYSVNEYGIIERIKGETHDFSRSDYWAFWIGRGGKYVRATGPCDEILADGEEVLVFPDFSPPPAYSPTVFPLAIEGIPAVVAPARPFTVTVVEFRTTTQYGDPGEGERRPRPGATVIVAGQRLTTDQDGKVSITLGARGVTELQAIRPGNARTAVESVCVSDGADGACGSTVPAPPAPDTDAPRADITTIAEKQRFTRARAPRWLAGTVGADRSGVQVVKLSLTRRHGGECWAYSPTKERFRGATCGKRSAFAIGDRSIWSYLLPERLPPGRYVLDAVAVDNAGNRDRLERGRSRVVFHVR